MKCPEDFIFIHVPKTGGTSVRTVLREHGKKDGLQHKSVASYIADYGNDIFDKKKGYAVIRDPVDRLVSAYFYGRHKFRIGHKGFPESRSEYFRKSSGFNSFCKLLNDSWNDCPQKLLIVKPQVSYICDKDGNVPVDLYLLEEIDLLVSDVFNNHFDVVAPSLPKINASKRKTVSEMNISTGTLDIIYKLYENDLLLYEEMVANTICNKF